MSIELKKKTMNDTVGEPSKFKATFKGYYKDKPVSFTIEAETERDLSYIIPLVPGRGLDLEIKDPQATLDTYFIDEKKIKQISADAEKILKEDDEAKFRAERRRRAEAQA
jgi:hypothetical protein